jgi:hypothetical protein
MDLTIVIQWNNKNPNNNGFKSICPANTPETNNKHKKKNGKKIIYK